MDPALVFVVGTALVALALVAAAALALARWKGAWRVTAALPALVLTTVVARIVIDTRRDPTSHNLWPLEIALWSLVGLGTMAVLFAARFVGRLRSRS